MSDFTSSFHSLAKPFKEKVLQLSDKSQLYQYVSSKFLYICDFINIIRDLFLQYSTLIKVTSSESSDIPGFVIEELIQISYENEVLGKNVY